MTTDTGEPSNEPTELESLVELVNRVLDSDGRERDEAVTAAFDAANQLIPGLTKSQDSAVDEIIVALEFYERYEARRQKVPDSLDDDQLEAELRVQLFRLAHDDAETDEGPNTEGDS